MLQWPWVNWTDKYTGVQYEARRHIMFYFNVKIELILHARVFSQNEFVLFKITRLLNGLYF